MSFLRDFAEVIGVVLNGLGAYVLAMAVDLAALNQDFILVQSIYGGMFVGCNSSILVRNTDYIHRLRLIPWIIDEKAPQPARALDAPRNIDGNPWCRYDYRVILKWFGSMKSTTNKDVMLLFERTDAGGESNGAQ